jgi:hypothetical protein
LCLTDKHKTLPFGSVRKRVELRLKISPGMNPDGANNYAKVDKVKIEKAESLAAATDVPHHPPESPAG